jgi:N-acetylglucosaminyldiphosphoundecaprenol N-acetyl-beta-D-mannosaminyltransferase
MAPRWMRSLGLEWLFRLIDQPSRWRRQTALIRFAVRAMAEAVARR